MITNICKFCGAMEGAEACPFCGVIACGEHSCIIHIPDDLSEPHELWACDDCLDKLPTDGSVHAVKCPDCPNHFDDGCLEHQRQVAEYDRVMNPVFQAWEEMLKRVPGSDYRILYNDGAAVVYHVSKQRGLVMVTKGNVEKLRGMELFIPAEVVED